MMDSYDLFSAMSGADEELIARSDFRVKRHKRELFSILTAAACVTVILISLVSLLFAPGPASLHRPPVTVPPETESTAPATMDPNQPLRLNGGDVGTLNIIQLSHVEEAASMPDFLMYVNQDDYHIAESAGTFHIYPVSGMAAGQMTLSWQGNINLEDAAQQQATTLRSAMETVSEPESDPLLGGLVICGSNNEKQAEVYIISDLQGGVFIFTLTFEPEDPDGHGIWFRDMLQTFEISTANREAPTWMTNLKASVDSFTTAFLKNDFSGVEGLLSENAEIYTYDADVLSETRVLQTHYKVDNDTVPKTAHVSVRHKYREPDAYDYITIELEYVDGKWQVSWAMIER